LLRSLEQPAEGALELLRIITRGGEIAFDVFGRALQDVQAITHAFELDARHDELVFAETHLLGAPARFVVALPARRPAVHARPTRSVGCCERAAAPLTPRPTRLRRHRPPPEFRHVTKCYDLMSPRPGINGKSSTDNNPGCASHTAGIALTSRPAVPAKPAVL